MTLAMGLSPSATAGGVYNRIQFEHGQLVVDRSKSIAEITKAQSAGGFPWAYPANHGADIGLGLYQGRMTTSLDLAMSEDGKLKLSTRIKTEPVIYVAREFPEDSCAYGLILRHEWQHYLYDRDVLRQMPDDIQAMSRDVFDNPRPQSPAHLERAKHVFFQRLGHIYEGRSFPLHSRIDNPEAYGELAKRCQGEIGRKLTAPNPG